MRKLTIYRRLPGDHEIRKSAEHPNIPDDWTPANILTRFGIRSHLKAVMTENDGAEWVLQDFEPQS